MNTFRVWTPVHGRAYAVTDEGHAIHGGSGDLRGHVDQGSIHRRAAPTDPRRPGPGASRLGRGCADVTVGTLGHVWRADRGGRRKSVTKRQGPQGSRERQEAR